MFRNLKRHWSRMRGTYLCVMPQPPIIKISKSHFAKEPYCVLPGLPSFGELWQAFKVRLFAHDGNLRLERFRTSTDTACTQ